MKLKTRTNQPVYYKLPVSSNIQSLSDDLLNSLRVGDVVQKKTGNQKHCYIVTYKEEKKGICLTYVDGSGYMETISYDYTGGHWVYNSKDVTQVPSDTHIADVVKTQVEGGTLSNAKPIYWHGIELYEEDNPKKLVYCHVLNNDPTPFTLATLDAWLKSNSGLVVLQAHGVFEIENAMVSVLSIYKRANVNNISMNYLQANSYTSITLSNLAQYFSNILDGVNKIN